MKLLTPAQAGELFDPPLSDYRVARLIESGALRAVNVGRKGYKHWRTTAEWVDEFRRGQTVRSAPPSGPESLPASLRIGLQYAKLRTPR